jgi:predicted O-methyltransferase YrrM
MGYSLREAGEVSAIHTLEAYEPQATLSKDLLTKELADMIHCTHGTVARSLATMLQDAPRIDFVFHDAGHTYEDYTHDFQILEPHLATGSILMLDDIRWEDSRRPTKPARTYEGWQAIVAHPRVKRAAEIDEQIGLALIGE